MGKGLFVLACLYTLVVAKEFLLPLALGVMVFFLLHPAVRGLKKVRIPESAGAALVLVGLVAAVALTVYALSFPAAAWVARAPQGVRRLEVKLRPLAQRIRSLTRTAAEMEKIAAVGETPVPEVQIKEPSFRETVLVRMQSFLGGAVIALTLVYFLLISGDKFLHKVVKTLLRIQDDRAVDMAREMEKQISEYLLLTSLINLGFGILVAGVLWLLGLPNPIMWGAVAAVTNFIPYLGGLVCTVVLALAAILTYDSLWQALLVPTVFWVLNTLEGYMITPLLMGKRFTLDPVVLFVALLFWWYVWGIAGALLAVPMMAAFKIVCERVEGLERLAVLLGEESPSGPVAARGE